MPIPISNVTRRVVYAASGTGPYAFTFEILANTDIAVYKDDALLTLTTDYTVTIASNGTGSITLVASPTGATQIAIVGNRTIQRTTDFVTGGDFFANTVNDEMDQQTIFAQQNAEGLQRALSAPQTDPTSINMTLPRAALRANKALGFDANGNPVIADTLGTNRGNWSSGVLYYVRDIVKDTTNNNIWQAIVQHTSSGSQPINTNADSAKWTLLVDAASATTSATNAASSASAAATSASAASSSATAASGSASTASTQASNAATSASNAASSASAASSSATSAASSATSAAASYDAFDDRYLGSKSSDPTVDNDGNTLLDGALYWDTTNNILKVYDLGATTWRRTTPTSSDQANINTVSGIAANVTTVAGISANVTTVAGISSNVTSVAGNSTNINTVATNITNVNSVGTNISNVNAVAGNSTNINAVNSNATNINTVAGVSGNVTTVATNSANVTTVAGSIASVNTNATNISNINQNAANITAIQNASANATAAASSATAAASSATSAASSAAAASAVVLGNEPVRPSIRPSLLLDFASTKQLDPRITFTRASTATFYNGVTTAMAEQNLFTYSQEFDNAAWTGNNVGTKPSVTANSVVAPDGTTTADSLNFTAQFQAVGQGTWVSGTTYTFSVWMKIASGTRDIVLGNSAAVTLATFTVTSTWTRFVYTGTSGASTFVALQDRNASGFVSVDIWGAQLEQRSAVTAYTATTTQAITNYIPVLQTAASGVARFDNNPTTGESLGLLIEESRTNLLTYSEQFDNAAWTKTQITVSANTVVAPDGTLTADGLIESVTNTQKFAYEGLTLTAATYTLSVYARRSTGSQRWLSLFPQGTGVSASAVYDVNSGSVTLTSGAQYISSSITAVGNNWYRCTLTFTAAAVSVLPVIYLSNASNAASPTYTGDGFSGLYLWGFQVELGAFATSYIPTVASQVTRAADAASMTGTNFSSWFNTAEGTFYGNAAPISLTGTYKILSTTPVAAGSFLTMSSNGGSSLTGWYAAGLGSLGTTLAENKLVAKYNTAKYFGGVMNGGTVVESTSSDFAGLATTLAIGQGSASYMNGTIKKIAYYPIRLTNAQIQGMTTV